MPFEIQRKPFVGDVDQVLAGASRCAGTLLLEGGSAYDGATWSALLFDPRWSLRATRDGRLLATGLVPSALRDPRTNLLEAIFALLPRAEADPGSPLFCGIAGYFGYEYGATRLGAARAQGARFDVDDVWLGAYDRALVFRRDDQARPTGAQLVVASDDLFGVRPHCLESTWREAERQLRDFQRTGASPLESAGTLDPRSFDRQWHRNAVSRIHDYLRAGDSYQVNLTGFVSARCGLDPYAVFRREAARNPVPFSAFLRTRSAALSCHSPELLLRLRGATAETAPIKGTLAEGPQDDSRLRASAKDMAEHVMIVDLCRNDLGRHARPGSVRVVDFATTLRLRGIVHLMSRIQAQVDPAHRAAVLSSLFPAGSITGAPKRRTLDIIAEVEPEERGPYTGSFGYAGLDGSADWNIAIRTGVWQDQWVHFGCGGGIVLDSEADREFEEAQWKASSFLDSLQATVTQGNSRATAGQ